MEKVVNFLSPSYFQAIAKVYKDGKEEKRYIWGTNFRVQSLGRYGRGSLSPSPIPILKDMKRIDVYVTENLSLKDKEVVHRFIAGAPKRRRF